MPEERLGCNTPMPNIIGVIGGDEGPRREADGPVSDTPSQ